jgi:ActR/RegA family two-component response regulator
MDYRILVVEDDPDVLEVLVSAFDRSGFYVDTATNVDQAISLMSARDYDILLTDKNLEDAQGEEEGGMRLLRYLRKEGNRTEAIMVTGHATIETAIEAMRLGAFDYILKPFSIEKLKAKIERIIEFRKFINPDGTIKSFKEFYNDLLKIFDDRHRPIDFETERSINSILGKVEFFFKVQKERERIMLEQREALAEISSNAEELREKLLEQGESHELLDNICTAANRRI